MDFQLKTVLISDDVDQKCIDILSSGGIQVVKNTKLTKDQLKAEIAKYDGLIVRSATKVTADVIAAGALGRLKLVGRAGTGVDNVDVPAATEHGVVVMNTPGGNTLSAVEHTCALLLAVSRHVSRGTACVRAGQWSDKKYLVGTELYGKTLAVIGLGRIGKEVALRMQAFGMTTIGHDPMTASAESRKFGVEWVTLDELWSQADYITLHTPLIAQTRHLINSETLAKCKRGVRVINCARGGIVDEQALLEALESGQCAAAGLDVFEQEPPTNTALLQHPLVTSTPHLGASTIDAQTRVAVDIAQQFIAFTRQTALTGAINGQAAAMAMDAENRPWIHLAGALGKLLRHLVEGRVSPSSPISIVTRGESVEKLKNSLSDAVLAQYIASPSEGATVNLVNAAAFAKNQGIQVNSVYLSVASSRRHSSSVMLEVRLAGRSASKLSVEGTVSDGMPQWTSVDGVEFCRPIGLQGHLLVSRAAASCTLDQLVLTLRDVIDDAKASGAYSLVSTDASSSSSSSWCVAALSSPVSAVTAPSQCDLLKSVQF